MNNITVKKSILLSAIVSTYNAAEFIQGCLEDLENQTIADRMEIIVVDSCSQQDEAAVVRDFQRRYANIKYIRTQIRESVYQAWNRGIKLAQGKYISNANTDDRHRQDAFEKMVDIMERDETIALVYADVIKTRTANETFNQCTPTGMFRWYDWDRKTLLERGCFIGPQPVWRKKVHDTYGYFEENYEISSDFEFWLRISQTNRFYHIAEPLGLYLDRQESVEHANHPKKVKEDTEILQRYRHADEMNILIGGEPGMKKDIPNRHQPVPDYSETSSREHINASELTNTQLKGENNMNSPAPIIKAIEQWVHGGMQEAAYWAMGKLVADFPENAQLHNEMAALAYEQGDMPMAHDHFKHAVSLEPGNLHYLKSYGDFSYVVQKDAEGALALYEKIIALDPENMDALMMAGHVSASLHRYAEAQQYYNRVIRLDPNNHEVVEIVKKMNHVVSADKTDGLTADECYDAARVEIQKGDGDAAISLLRQLLSQDDTHALAHNDLGVLYYESGNMEAALAHYERAAELMPENQTFQKNLADFYWSEMGDHQRGMERYVHVLKLNPKDIEAQLSCGQICLALGKIDDAKDFVHVVLEIEPWNENARKLLDQLEHFSEKAGNLESAAQSMPEGTIEEMKSRLEKTPGDAVLHNNLGVLYYESGEKYKAVASYQQAVQLSPDDPKYKKNLADFYVVEQGRAEDAMKLYLEILSKNPHDVEALNATGMICTALGKLDDARYFFQRVLEIEPSNESAAEALKKIEVDAAGEYAEFKKDCMAG